MSECTKNLNQIVTYLNELKILWHEPDVRKEWKKIKNKTPLYKIRKYLLKHKGRDIIKHIITLYDDIKDNYECKQIINTKINQLIDYKNRLTTALLTILESDRQLILNELSRIDKYNHGKSHKTINLMNYFEPLKTKKKLTNNSKSETKNVVQPKIIKETEIIRNTSQPPEKLNSDVESKKTEVLDKDTPRNKRDDEERKRREKEAREEKLRKEKEAREEKLRKEKEAREDKLRKQKEEAEKKRQEREDRLKRQRNEAADRRRREQNARRDRSDSRRYSKSYDREGNGQSKSDRRDNAYDRLRALTLEKEAARQRERDWRREQDKIRICNELKLKIIRNNTNTTEADIEVANKIKEKAQNEVDEIVGNLKKENNPVINNNLDELSSNDSIQKLITDLIKKLETAISAGATGPDKDDDDEEDNSKLKHDECNDGADAAPAAPAAPVGAAPSATNSNLEHDECNGGSSVSASAALASVGATGAAAATGEDNIEEDNSNLEHDECNDGSSASASAAASAPAAPEDNSNLEHDECNGGSSNSLGGGGTKTDCTDVKFSDNLYLKGEASSDEEKKSGTEYECTLIDAGRIDEIHELKNGKRLNVQTNVSKIKDLIKDLIKQNLYINLRVK